MQFLHEQYILTTIREESLTEKNSVAEALQYCIDNKCDITLTVRMNGTHSMTFDRVRVNKVNAEEAKVDFTVLEKSHNFRRRGIPFSHLDRLHVVGYPMNDEKFQEEVTRFDMMDLS